MNNPSCNFKGDELNKGERWTCAGEAGPCACQPVLPRWGKSSTATTLSGMVFSLTLGWELALK